MTDACLRFVTVREIRHMIARAPNAKWPGDVAIGGRGGRLFVEHDDGTEEEIARIEKWEFSPLPVGPGSSAPVDTGQLIRSIS